MRKALTLALLVLLGAPQLWAEHFRFSRFYGPGGYHSYRYPGHGFTRFTPYNRFNRGYGFGIGFYNRGYWGGGFNRGYGYDRYGYGSGFGYPVRGYPARYYSNYDTRGTYLVYLGPSNPAEVVRANYSDLIFNVTPNAASVYVDGSLIGSARSFATHRDRFPIVEGEHQLRIEYPGYQAFETTLQVVPNRNLHIDVELTPQPSGR